MKSVGVLLILVAACSNGGANDDDYPIAPPGGGGADNGGGGGGSGGDAGSDGGGIDASANITGKACLITDLRVPGGCPEGASGVTVKLGTLVATTDATGAFTIARQPGADTWEVSGGPIADPVFTTIMPLVDGDEIPVITLARYQELSVGNGVQLADDLGAIVARAVRGVVPLPSTTAAAVAPLTAQAILYDGVSADTWETTSTGANGIVWLAGASGSGILRVTPMAGSRVDKLVGVRVSAITFVTIQVP